MKLAKTTYDSPLPPPSTAINDWCGSGWWKHKLLKTEPQWMIREWRLTVYLRIILWAQPPIKELPTFPFLLYLSSCNRQAKNLLTAAWRGREGRNDRPWTLLSTSKNEHSSSFHVILDFSFTRLIVEDMESPSPSINPLRDRDWWCTKGKVKVNRFSSGTTAEILFGCSGCPGL